MLWQHLGQRGGNMKKSEVMQTATMEIKTIQNVEDFNNWANRVNEAYHKEHLNKLQDIFAGSDLALMKKMFNSDDGGRKLWLFAIMKCMGEELVLDFIKSLARSLVDRDVEKEERRLEEQLNKKILDYDWRRLEFDKQEAKLKSEIVRLEIKLNTANRLKDEAESDLNNVKAARDTFRRDSDRLDEIRNVLREILNL
jgi:hypothetical protein